MRRCRVGKGESSLAEMRNYDFFFDLHIPYKSVLMRRAMYR